MVVVVGVVVVVVGVVVVVVAKEENKANKSEQTRFALNYDLKSYAHLLLSALLLLKK